MIQLPSFASWFAAVNEGREPLPWQDRLANQVLETGWPSLIGVPTGLGKTACIDIAVWAMAAEADLSPHERVHPRRIWYVVNRRLLVDAGATKATRLAEMLGADAPPDENVAAISERLKNLGGLGELPLHVASLRGGAELGLRPSDPAQPAIILATPAMFGSRWLFRGFGTSVGMRSVDAGLAGSDSLVLLDEAHLARPLRRLEEQTVGCDRGRSARLLPGGRGHVRFTELTATGDDRGDRFDLDDSDLAHPVVRQRLDAAKTVQLVESNKKKLVEELFAQAQMWIDGPSSSGSCLLFCNDPRTARSVHAKLVAATGAKAEVWLLTGRMREREARVVRDLVLDPVHGCPSGSRSTDRQRPLLIVATQTLEVGADIDVDHLITVSAGARALIQRFGRLNRLGDKPSATGVIVHVADSDGGIYGDESTHVWQRLVDYADESQTLSLSPSEIATVIGPPHDEIVEPPMLLPGILWEWAKTTVAPPGEAPVEVFVEGRAEQLRRLQVCWRAVREPYLVQSPLVEGDEISEAEHPKLVPPVTVNETVEIPVHEFQDAVRTSQGEQGPSQVTRLTGDRSALEWVDPSELRSGDTVVLSPNDGLYDEFGWNPDSSVEVADVSLFDGQSFILHRDAINNFLAGDGETIRNFSRACEDLGRLPDDSENSSSTATFPSEDELSLLRPRDPHRWQQVVAAVRELIAEGASSVAVLEQPVQDVAPYLRFIRTTGRASASLRLEAMEELSFANEWDGPVQSPVLVDHLHHVGSHAEHIALSIGLSADLIEACRRAGEFHDLGKFDERFQRWLAPKGDARGAMAKSSYGLGSMEQLRRAAGWPKGGRHETLSLRLARAHYAKNPPDDHDDDLVLHLIASHHGHGRPSMPPCNDKIGGTVSAAVRDQQYEVSADLSVIDWDQPARFHRLCDRYGLWGLALLEAVVRQADHAVSKVAVA